MPDNLCRAKRFMMSVAPVVFGDVSRPLLVAGKPGLRVCKAVCILNNQAIGLFSDEVVVSDAP